MPEQSDLKIEESPIIPFSPKNQELKDRLNSIATRAGRIKIYNELVIRSKYLRGKYADWETRETYHVTAGSGLLSSKGRDYYTPEDFPGEDSTPAFLKELETKFHI